VVVEGVREPGAAVEQPGEPARELVAEPEQVVGAELIHGNEDDERRGATRGGRGLAGAAEGGERDHEQGYAFHRASVTGFKVAEISPDGHDRAS
jgi:hypothetical protein